MSAIALSLDPSSMIGSRRGLSWQDLPTDHQHHHQHNHLEDTMFGDDFNVVGQISEGGTISPISAKSSTSSLSLSFPPEQHELKRQQDRVRRDSRLSARMRRYSNQSFSDTTMMGSSNTMGNLGLAIYNSTTHTTVPLIAESLQLMPTSSFMPAYSPTPSEHSHGYQIYSQHPLPQAYNIPMDYTAGYLGANEFGNIRQSQTQAPVPSTPENSLMYQMPSSPPATAQDAAAAGIPSSRPKPRCWEHGCNGRQFSTFSNLLRHQREKSGQAAKATCPNCGAEFTRTTARNGHMLHDKCKRRTGGSTSA